jgi:hypothetical protein
MPLLHLCIYTCDFFSASAYYTILGTKQVIHTDLLHNSGCSERRLIEHSFYRRNFLRKSCPTNRERCRRAAPCTEKSDKPAQRTPYATYNVVRFWEKAVLRSAPGFQSRAVVKGGPAYSYILFVHSARICLVPNFAVVRLTPRLYIYKVSGWNLGSEIALHDWGFSWFTPQHFDILGEQTNGSRRGKKSCVNSVTHWTYPLLTGQPIGVGFHSLFVWRIQWRGSSVYTTYSEYTVRRFTPNQQQFPHTLVNSGMALLSSFGFEMKLKIQNFWTVNSLC